MHPQHVDQQLAQLAEAFAHWRQCRSTPRERIPESLWQQAVCLTRVLPMSRVAKRLGLGTSDLKKRCTNHAVAVTAQDISPTIDFVELTPGPSWPTPSIDVDIRRPDGSRMHLVCQHQSASLAALIRAFLETS